MQPCCVLQAQMMLVVRIRQFFFSSWAAQIRGYTFKIEVIWKGAYYFSFSYLFLVRYATILFWSKQWMCALLQSMCVCVFVYVQKKKKEHEHFIFSCVSLLAFASESQASFKWFYVIPLLHIFLYLRSESAVHELFSWACGRVLWDTDLSLCCLISTDQIFFPCACCCKHTLFHLPLWLQLPNGNKHPFNVHSWTETCCIMLMQLLLST